TVTGKLSRSTDSPATQYCCICRTSLSTEKPIAEHRPTGEFGEIEAWFYCLSCWFEMKKLQEKSIRRETLLHALDLVTAAEE
ncbi:MAG: hypothetical protein ACWGQW_22105, partial [bacterium]